MNHPPAAHHQQPEQASAPPFWRSRYAIGLLVFGAVAAYFLLSEHRAHFIGALPYLLLLACPLMHVFMHGGHGSGHGDHGGGGKPGSGTSAPKTGERP
ncbi:MAG: DUF2933 domain-containing protein [Cytophagales bacterium]|nr:DUF2933 domain-containing protein [Rhizobacter sp.]